MKGKKIVLVGGCFDILHPGHVIFLEKAKKEGDLLVVLLESDQKVHELKGLNRPIHTQKARAKVLSALRSVDRVVMLPFMHKEEEYDAIIQKIKPKVIAATSGDYANKFKQRSAKLVGSKLKYVTRLIGNHSSSKILTNKA
ncbi:TPA: glycerol-3-phosphate cytidylyltransferase [Candidatus Daviesbacteria bacterium]|uniref:Glycerol-3-phosphate cytidyltransferase TagD n=1 Tax=Candidatus Daviesbacteria bacterium GW2011_GWF2_38_6 TaxID=1618432 RepID=A0A0G0MXA9_9BACT|nr:MAG: Glycerol-3-phosphate cytidyltransferase TagD [Candidatus Daviesbacteria bacterium GW2011_GWF2_38_6]HBQ51076.1 glycerol-3-phosphate cytidylyltransferase [Candidatus Daviesbacteria bacterium]HCB22317.1 glycerol-3-phosphate cytidylyltransferase [Candidatus Daviesbacteria bacterium]